MTHQLAHGYAWRCGWPRFTRPALLTFLPEICGQPWTSSWARLAWPAPTSSKDSQLTRLKQIKINSGTLFLARTAHHWFLKTGHGSCRYRVARGVCGSCKWTCFWRAWSKAAFATKNLLSSCCWTAYEEYMRFILQMQTVYLIDDSVLLWPKKCIPLAFSCIRYLTSNDNTHSLSCFPLISLRIFLNVVEWTNLSIFLLKLLSLLTLWLYEYQSLPFLLRYWLGICKAASCWNNIIRV